jgi:hypothetical protein
MADPATQFQPAGLNVPYQYTPVETRLASPMQLQPVSYAGVQSALENFGAGLMKGPLNPAVRAQMQYEAAGYGQGAKAWEQMTPKQRKLVSLAPGGPTMQAPITGGPLEFSDTESGTQPPATVKRDSQGNVVSQVGSTVNPDNQQPSNATSETPTVTQSIKTGVSATGGVNLGGGGAQPGGGTQPYMPGNPQKATGPPSYIYNPQTSATNLFQAPGQTNAPAAPSGVDQNAIAQVPAQVRAQLPGGGVNPTLSASTDTGQAVQLAQQGQGQQPNIPATIARPNIQDQQQLAAWQGQNAHPVMSSQDALNWAKNFDTGVHRATYLPNGGPGQQPAFAFHMKGGGVNTVPLSQMVSNGAGPLIAGQNTSAVLSGSDQIEGQSGQGQQPPPAAPGQPTDQMQPTGAVGGQQPQGVAQTPEQQQYLTQQTALPSQGGNIATMMAGGDTESLLAANGLHTNNPSNVPQSISSSHEHPIPNGEVQGQPNVAVNQMAARNRQDWNSLPDGSNPDNKQVATSTDPATGLNIKWFQDQYDPKKPDSQWPYLVYNTTPWSEMRMPNDGRWQSYEHILPNRLLDHAIYDNLHQDSTVPDPDHPKGWSQQDKIDALKQFNWDHSSNAVPLETQNRLNSLLQQSQYAQRLYELTKDPGWDAGDYQTAAKIRNDLANNQGQFKGAGWLDQGWRGVTGFLSGNKIDPKYTYAVHAMDALKGGLKDANLNQTERDELKGVDLNGSLPNLIGDLYQKRKDELNQQISQSMSNKERLDYGYVAQAKAMGADGRGRLKDDGSVRFAGPAPSATPAPAPSPTPRLGTSFANPVPVHDQGTIDNLPSGTHFQLPNGQKFRKK